MVDELLDWLHLQEAEALRDGVQEQEPVGPTDTGLDGGRLRTFLEKGEGKATGRSPGSMAAIPKWTAMARQSRFINTQKVMHYSNALLL